MTKYRLKDAELQKKFDEISNGDFSRGLRRFIESGYLGTGPNFVAFGDMQPCGFADGFGNFRRFSVCLLKHELEIVKEYNPNDWNDYPDVTPLEGELMRVEVEYPEGDVLRQCAIFEDGIWWNEENGNPNANEVEYLSAKVKRFRPWE